LSVFPVPDNSAFLVAIKFYNINAKFAEVVNLVYFFKRPKVLETVRNLYLTYLLTHRTEVALKISSNFIGRE